MRIHQCFSFDTFNSLSWEGMEIVKNNKIKNIFVNWKNMVSSIYLLCVYVTVMDFFSTLLRCFSVAIGSLDNSLRFTFDDHSI